MSRVILASASPRRRELLAQTGIEFEVKVAAVDETAVVEELNRSFSPETMGENSASAAKPSRILSGYPAAVVETLSASKARAVAELLLRAAQENTTQGMALGGTSEKSVVQERTIILGSDTIVWNGEVLGKPENREDAYRMLRALQGNRHSVFTGVTVLVLEGNKREEHTFSCETGVEVYPMTEQETNAYLDTGEPMDKAGAYGIQGKFGLWVKGIEGDYNSVVGLPVSALWQVLKDLI